jgi:SAM-dependent methyltransferase
MKMKDKKYRIVKDEKFGYLRANPIPSIEEVNQYYLEEFYSQNKEKFNNSSLDTQLEDLGFLNAKYENYWKNAVNILGDLEGKSIFDIGFGFAQALLFFRDKNMIVSGIEPSKEGYEYAKSKKLAVSNGSIESTFTEVEEKQTVVTLLNVLEHLREPAEVLTNIREKLLDKDGLLIIDVPNDYNDFQLVANEEYGLKEWWFFPPRHINYFNSTSLSELLEKTGYEVKYVEGSFPLELFLLFGDLYIGNNSLGKECHNKRMKFEATMRRHGKQEKLSSFYKALADLELGRDVVIYAQPKKEL